MNAVIDALLTENRQLRQELERLRAIERSRWLRLNPRRLLRRYLRLPRSIPSSRAAAQQEPVHPDVGLVDPLIRRFREEIVSRGAFSHEWFLGNIPTWAPVLRHLEGRKVNLLEIGSFEGLSACFLLWRLPDATITCVDTFAGSVEHRFMYGEVSQLESAFDANIALVDSTRVRKLAGDSRRVLLELTSEETRFDLVYVDGSHLGLDVIVDASFAWQLLAAEGTIVFDDYRWAELGEDPLLRPGPAVDAFLTVIGGKYELLFAGYQLGVRKVSVA